MTKEMNPTPEELNRARAAWLQTLDRAHDAADAGYFDQNWRKIPNCTRFVKAELAKRPDAIARGKGAS